MDFVQIQMIWGTVLSMFIQIVTPKITKNSVRMGIVVVCCLISAVISYGLEIGFVKPLDYNELFTTLLIIASSTFGSWALMWKRVFPKIDDPLTKDTKKVN